jgi:phosphate transport system permease protein
MTTTTPLEPDFAVSAGLVQPQLPRWAALLIAAMSLATAGLLTMLLGWHPVAGLIVAAVLFIVGLPLWSRLVEGGRAAADRFATCLVWTAFAAVVVPLIWLIWLVLKNGFGVLSVEFLTYSMRGVVGDGGGIYHALIGTLLVTLAAALISVPIGLFTAIYLVEYGRGRIARGITFLVDVMTGIPSIVAGLFAFALFELLTGDPGYRSGIGGAVALSLLMIPIVVRSSEEMLKLVPNELREASYALGVPKWLTVVKIVLPTALAGIVTGVMLAIARIVGETAPLLLIAGFTDSMNYDLFGQRMMSLPVFVYTQYSQPGSDPAPYIERAWTGALALILIVLVLNVVARLVARFFAPKLPR